MAQPPLAEGSTELILFIKFYQFAAAAHCSKDRLAGQTRRVARDADGQTRARHTGHSDRAQTADRRDSLASEFFAERVRERERETESTDRAS